LECGRTTPTHQTANLNASAISAMTEPDELGSIFAQPDTDDSAQSC
jgi:hypothetical protein